MNHRVCDTDPSTPSYLSKLVSLFQANYPGQQLYLLNHRYHNNISNVNIQQWAPGRGIWTARWAYSLTGLLGASWQIVSNGRWTWHSIRIAMLLVMGRTMTLSGTGLHPTAPPLFREISLLLYISELSVPRCTKINIFFRHFQRKILS